MKSKVVYVMAGAAVVLGTSFIVQQSVSADTLTLNSPSKGTVTFVQSTEGIQILDPNDNSKTMTPNTNDGTVNTTNNIDGGLYLSYVPNFNFNTHKVNQIRDKVFFANAQAEGRPNFVQVSDLRSKNSNKWSLGVSVGDFNKINSDGTIDKTDQLTGSAIILRNVKDQNVTNGSTTSVSAPTLLGTTYASLMNDQNSAANASANEGIYKLEADGSPNNLLTANGTHLLTAGDESTSAFSVGLYVQKNTQSAATYQSEITWTLSTNPTSGN